MSSVIYTGAPSQAVADTTLNNAPLHSNAPPATGQASSSGTEAVTVSSAAQTTTKLLESARTSPGVNGNQVAQLRSAIQNGTYSVSPEDLATAISASLKDRAT